MQKKKKKIHKNIVYKKNTLIFLNYYIENRKLPYFYTKCKNVYENYYL